VTSDGSAVLKGFRFASPGPLAKVAVWLSAIVLLAALVDVAAWALGIEFGILRATGGGRNVLRVVALGSLVLMMVAEGRRPRDVGLVVSDGWHYLLLGGFLVGLMMHLAVWMAASLLGGVTLQTSQLATGGCGRAALTALEAFPAAMLPQVVFSGYLLAILADRNSRVTAVIVPAFLFAVVSHMRDPSAILAAENCPQLVGLFMLGTLLGSLRLLAGSVFLPVGLLAGCTFARRFVGKVGLLGPGDNAEIIGWMVPLGDPLKGPVTWLALGLAVGVCGVLLARRKEEELILKSAARPAVDSGFKRIFPFSNSCMLAPLDLWLGRLADARFRVGWKYLPRLTAILIFSSVNTVLSLPERLLAPLLLRRRPVPDPVFIVGMHRSGTTHLHNLLALDDRFCTPRAYHILNAAGFLSGSWLVAPLMAAFLPWRRPMDGVRFHIVAPQEDEFVLAGVSRLSPYWALSFPRRWAAYSRFIFPGDFSPEERAAWKRHLLLFLRKLSFWSGKRPLLKNPYNTARAGLLHEMFPGARFIHVHRHPYDVYRSNMHLAREGHVVYQLQDPDPCDCYQTRFLEDYRDMEEAFRRESEKLPECQVAEVAFEDLERDPIRELERVYARLGLEFTPRFRARLEHYLATLADYQKNRFPPLPDEVRQAVDAHMGDFMARCGYGAQGQVARGQARKAA
jgi:hypothetical protein